MLREGDSFTNRSAIRIKLKEHVRISDCLGCFRDGPIIHALHQYSKSNGVRSAGCVLGGPLKG